MKRNYSSISSEVKESNIKLKPLSDIKHSIPPIFNISRVAPQNIYHFSSQEVSSHALNDIRVSASSKVNFSKLSLTEQRQRYINQTKEIKKLRAKLKKFSKEKTKDAFERALEVIREGNCITCNRHNFLESLTCSIISGRLKPNTLAFNQISTILRDVLGLRTSNIQYAIQLGETTIPISSLEYEAYKEIACTERVLRCILGRKQREVEDPNELFNIICSKINKKST